MQYIVDGKVYDTIEEAELAEKKLKEVETLKAEAVKSKVDKITALILEHLALSMAVPVEEDGKQEFYYFGCIDSTYLKNDAELYVNALIEDCLGQHYGFSVDDEPVELYQIKKYSGNVLKKMAGLITSYLVEGDYEFDNGLCYIEADEINHYCLHLDSELVKLLSEIKDKVEESKKCSEDSMKRQVEGLPEGVTVHCIPLESADWIPELMRILMSF